MTYLIVDAVSHFQSVEVSIAAAKALAVMSENVSSSELIGKLGTSHTLVFAILSCKVYAATR